MYLYKLDDVLSCELGMPDVVSTRLSPWLNPPSACDEAAYLSSQLEFLRRKKKRDQSSRILKKCGLKLSDCLKRPLG
jgi:hypothetical protein